MTPQSPDPRYRVHHYPATLIETRALGRAGPLTLRPILPQDGELLGQLISGLTPQTRRNRFHGAVTLSAVHLQTMCCVDDQHQLAVVVTAQIDGAECLIADARYCVEHEGHGAEFALVVAERWQRHGVGAWAMRTLLQAATDAGLEWLHGDVLQGNAPMLALMQRCGFALCPDPEDDQIVRVQRRLGAPVVNLPRVRHGIRSWFPLAWPGMASVAAR